MEEPVEAASDYMHISLDTYDLGITDQETAVFSTGDGTTAQCFFEATSGKFNFAQKMFEVDETVGSCNFGEEQIKISTDETEQDNFAELADTQNELPQAQATLDIGEMVHLGHMGCWAPTVAELGCLDFASDQAFSLNEKGFHHITSAEVVKQLTNTSGQVQALSRINTFEFLDGTSLSCVSESLGSRFSCFNSEPAGWESTDGTGPANTLSWELGQSDAEFVGAHPSNPGPNIYESQQILQPGSYLLASGVSAEFDGNTLAFTTPNGNKFWADTHSFGAGEA
ncbi:hypothetical protein ccrud_12455 [Corynebacterium crudilactis]|uniref:Uncharacterized protein n=2 Tax=Corynebacterium crudilactis TaxID=1652495 RepID=A0A172QXH5_9CORY|nr:hypothetical protein ccrud_12455 [Corynebacterium crudilactis]